MKLHTFRPSPNTFKVLAVIHQLGLEHEVVDINLIKGESMTDEFKLLNPNGKIPVLEDGDLVVWESHAIMLYLAEKHNSSLIPDDLVQRARMHQWMAWSLAHFSPALGGLTFERIAPNFIPDYEPDQHTLTKSLANLERFCPVLDRHLEGRDFVLGGQPSLADLTLAAPVVLKEMAQLPLDGYANLMAWFGRVMQLPYFREALPKQPIGA